MKKCVKNEYNIAKSILTIMQENDLNKEVLGVIKATMRQDIINEDLALYYYFDNYTKELKEHNIDLSDYWSDITEGYCLFFGAVRSQIMREFKL